MKAIADPLPAARGSRHTLSVHTSWITATQACLLLVWLIMVGTGMCRCQPALGADQLPAAPASAPEILLTFEEAAKIAITQSPAFTKSSLDIDIRRIDETDSRFGLVPPLTFRTYYYVNRPSGAGSGKPYSLSFTTDPYNPLGAYFTLQAQKLATKAAVLSHLSLISNGLESLGGFYLQLEAMHKLAGYQKELVKVNQENLIYMENRVAIGTGTSLDVKLAQQELRLAQGEAEGIALAIKRDLIKLRNFLGLPSNQKITPAFHDSRRQVLGNFNPDTVTVEEVKSRSYDLKVIGIYKQLQEYNISLAIAKSFPTIIFNTQTPDPLNVSTGQGLYVGIGLEIPVWDGFTRIRNISRQKAMLKQVEAKKGMKEIQLEDKWLDQIEKIREKNLALKNAQAVEEVARLKANQQEVRYHSGEIPLPAFLESRKALLKAQQDTLSKGLQHDVEVLKLRENSGDLGHSYVDASSWQK